MKITGAIFDMDGTLVDSLMIWDVLWENLGVHFLGKSGFRPSREDDRAVRTMTLIDAMALIHKNYGIDESGEALWRYVTDFMANFYKTDVKLKSGVSEFLEGLRKNGVKMCIASATAPDLVKLAMVHCGIDGYFPELISCADVGRGKEHPDVFLKALEYLGTDLDTTWVFEDSAVALETASRAGFRTVGIYDRYNFGQDRAKSASDIYINDGETLKKAAEVLL
ncbi:MAG: HAD family phosphatase [Ruminococcaceae bacterium]|nr:HAD family phosphatase [Oscillospiraceae bacterium]